MPNASRARLGNINNCGDLLDEVAVAILGIAQLCFHKFALCDFLLGGFDIFIETGNYQPLKNSDKHNAQACGKIICKIVELAEFICDVSL